MKSCSYCKKQIPNEPIKPFSYGFCSWDCYYAKKQLDYLKQEKIPLPTNEYIEPKNLPLTPAQEEFCNFYIEYHSDSKAYLESFPHEVDMSVDKARKKGRFLRKLPFIKRRITELIEEQIEHLASNRLKVIDNLVIVSTSDLRDYFDKNGELLPPSEWTYEMGLACKKYSVKYNKEGGVAEKTIELYDKLRALMSLAKIEEMYKSVTEVNVNHSIVSAIKTFGDDDMVAKLLENELNEAKNLAYKPKEKEVIDVDVEGDSNEDE